MRLCVSKHVAKLPIDFIRIPMFVVNIAISFLRQLRKVSVTVKEYVYLLTIF